MLVLPLQDKTALLVAAQLEENLNTETYLEAMVLLEAEEVIFQFLFPIVPFMVVVLAEVDILSWTKRRS